MRRRLLLVPGVLAGALACQQGTDGFRREEMDPGRFPLAPFLESFGLGLQVYLLSPASLGVARWEVGDHASYAYGCDGARPREAELSPLVAFDVIGSADEQGLHHAGDEPPGDERFWLRGSGLAGFRGVPGDDYRVASPAELRVTSELSFTFTPDYFPIPTPRLPLPQLVLERRGTETIETAAGRMECEHLTGRAAPDLPAVELWANPAVRPLGIVRLELGPESLQLVACGKRAPEPLDARIVPTMQRTAPVLWSCASCHVERRGRSDALAGIDVTDDLHHRMRAGLFRPDREPLVVSLLTAAGETEGTPGAQLRITTELGSMRVRNDESGHVVLYMNGETVSSHLRITPLAGCTSEFARDVRHPVR